MTTHRNEPKPFISVRTIPTIAVSPDDAPRALGISKSSMDKLVKNGKIRPPVQLPGMRRVAFDWERLVEDWRSLRDESEDRKEGAWDGDETL
jgi:hypothetical protein